MWFIRLSVPGRGRRRGRDSGTDGSRGRPHREADPRARTGGDARGAGYGGAGGRDARANRTGNAEGDTQADPETHRQAHAQADAEARALRGRQGSRGDGRLRRRDMVVQREPVRYVLEARRRPLVDGQRRACGSRAALGSA